MDKTEQAERAILIFCAHAMTMSDEYTRFLGMFKFKEKQKFNDLVKACESFVKTMKDNLTEEKQENVQELNDLMCDFYYSLIKGESIKIIKDDKQDI